MLETSRFIILPQKKEVLKTTLPLLTNERAGVRTRDNLIKSQVLYQLSYTPKFLTNEKCPVPESNQRHEDFQSSALPTELTGQLTKKELRGQDLNL